jgi:predicted ATP-grasp superfamily ATP-dependent carboligase
VAHIWRLASMRKISKGRKAHIVRTPEELRRAYAAMGDGPQEVMIQEVIGGRDEQLFTFLAYLNRESVPLAYCVRSKIRQFPVDFGYCTMTVSCHNDAVVEQSLRLLQGIGYSGICGVEFKFDSATGEYKLIEINARPVNTIGIAPACGVDIPYIAFRDLLGEKVEAVTTWRAGVRWYLLTQDFWAVRALRAHGGESFAEWLASLRGKHTEAVIAWDDMRPAAGFYFQELGKRLGGVLTKITGYRTGG